MLRPNELNEIDERTHNAPAPYLLGTIAYWFSGPKHHDCVTCVSHSAVGCSRWVESTMALSGFRVLKKPLEVPYTTKVNFARIVLCTVHDSRCTLRESCFAQPHEKTARFQHVEA